MSDIGGIFTMADIVELAAALLLLVLAPGAAAARRILEMNRGRWAGQSPEQIWRRLVAGRIVEAAFFLLAAGAVFAVLRSDSAIPSGFYAIPSAFLLAGFAQAFRCARATARGWSAMQDGALGRRAQRLAGATGSLAPVETPA